MNQWTPHAGGLPAIRDFSGQVKAAFPGAEEGHQGLAIIQFSQHAELTITLHFWGKGIVSTGAGKIEITRTLFKCYTTTANTGKQNH